MAVMTAPSVIDGSTAVAEAPLGLKANRRRVGSRSYSPDALPALATGWILARGYLDAQRRPPTMDLVDDAGIIGIRAQLPAEDAGR